jgi:hypothetical protein
MRIGDTNAIHIKALISPPLPKRIPTKENINAVTRDAARTAMAVPHMLFAKRYPYANIVNAPEHFKKTGFHSSLGKVLAFQSEIAPLIRIGMMHNAEMMNNKPATVIGIK